MVGAKTVVEIVKVVKIVVEVVVMDVVGAGKVEAVMVMKVMEGL